MAAAAPTRSLRRRLLNFFALDPGEVRPALLLTLYLLLAMASVVALKASGDSLFLKRFSSAGLPYAYVATAATAGFVVSLYIRLSARLPQNRLVIYTQLFFSSNLALFWLLLRLQLDWIPAVIYVWTQIYSVIIVSQVWTLANHLFTTRQARRLFSVVGSGGILGAVIGGQLTFRLAKNLGTQNLLLACVSFLLACSLIVAYLWHTARMAAAPTRGRHQAPPSSLSDSWHAIRGSRLLLLLTALVVLSALVNGMVDFQFKSLVNLHIKDRNELTAFMGGFTSYLALIGLAVQILLTSRIMRWFGGNIAVFVLPLAMATGSSVLLFSTTLAAAVLIKGFDRAFRHSVDRSAVELLYVPLPGQAKQQAKSFIDVVASRSADALAGILLALLTKLSLGNLLPLSVQQLSLVNLVLILPWLALAWLLRREYVNQLRSSIERKDISAEALLVELAGAGASEELSTALTSSDERAVETGLGLLQYGSGNVASARLGSLLTHLSPAIRRKALAIVLAKKVPGCGDQVARFLYLDDHVDSLWQALDYLEMQDPGHFPKQLNALMESNYPLLKGAAAARLLGLSDSPFRSKAAEVFTAFVEKAKGRAAVDRRRAAELLGRAPANLGCQRVLGDFLNDADPEVVRAAAISTGRSRQRNLFPRLLELAGDRRWKTEARQALAAFGIEILPELNRVLLDPGVPLGVRRNLPRVFSSIGGQRAADYLAAGLDQPDSRLQYPVVRAMSRIRLRQGDVRFDPDRVSPRIVAELRRYYRYQSFLQDVPRNGAVAGTQLLRRALSEQLNRRLDVIFRLIGLLYPPKDIFDAYYGVSSGRRDLRANALEFLDSTLLNPVRQMLLPIIEDRGPERIIEHARSLFGIERGGYPKALRELLAEPDPWVQTCAAYAAADQGLREIEPLLEPLARSPDALLQETARAAQERLRRLPTASSPGGLWKH